MRLHAEAERLTEQVYKSRVFFFRRGPPKQAELHPLGAGRTTTVRSDGGRRRGGPTQKPNVTLVRHAAAVAFLSSSRLPVMHEHNS